MLIRPDQRLGQCGKISRVPRHLSDAVKCLADPAHAVHRHRAMWQCQAVEPTEAGREDVRASCLGADAQGGKASCYGDRRPGRGASTPGLVFPKQAFPSIGGQCLSSVSAPSQRGIVGPGGAQRSECVLMGSKGRLSRLEATELSEIAFSQDDHSCFEEPVH